MQADSATVTGKVTNGDLTKHVFLGARGGISKDWRMVNEYEKRTNVSRLLHLVSVFGLESIWPNDRKRRFLWHIITFPRRFRRLLRLLGFEGYRAPWPIIRGELFLMIGKDPYPNDDHNKTYGDYSKMDEQSMSRREKLERISQNNTQHIMFGDELPPTSQVDRSNRLFEALQALYEDWATIKNLIPKRELVDDVMEAYDDWLG